MAKKKKAKKLKKTTKTKPAKTLSENSVKEPEIIPPTTNATAADKSLVSSDPMARYLAEVRRYPLLTKEEEYELAVKYYESGDREAAQKLVTSNLRFVVKVAGEYSKFGAKLLDLVQEGNVGLMHAVKEFNPYKGVRLITYAVWWIRGQIQDHLMRHFSMVRIGTTAKQRKLFYELQKQKDQLERMGFDAGIAQISGRLGIPEDEVKEVGKRVLNRDVSLDKPAGADDSSSTLIDLQTDQSEILPDEDLAEKEQLQIMQDHIDKIRDQLSEREVYVLEKRLLSDDPLTLQEIGDKYKITREAARQMEARLIKKIRNQMGVEL